MALSPVRPKRILLIKIRPDKIGDVLLATPAIHALKLVYPEAQLTMWVHPGIAAALQNNPDLEAVGPTTFRPTFKQGLDHIRRMRAGKFDMVIFLKDRAGSHIPLSWMARISRRVGSVRKWYGKLLTENLDMLWDASPKHEAELCYEMLERALGVKLERLPTSMPVATEDETRAGNILREIGVKGEYFCLHAGTAGTSQPWPADLFAATARKIIKRTGLPCVLTGMKSEIDLVANVAAQIGDKAFSAAGKTDLLTLAALLKNSNGLVTGSTGTMHIAAAQQTPLVVVEPMPDAAERIPKWHPWMSPHKAILATKVCEGCAGRNCHGKGRLCMDSISIDEVVETAIQLFKPRSG